jgi:lysophospholipase L1-like esterase
MKRILIYGDSNAWGGTAHERYTDEQQWPNILQKKLGKNYTVVQEGLPGRFAGKHSWDGDNDCDGQLHFKPTYRSASPVDIVVLALGMNDLSDRIDSPADQIVNDILWYENKANEMLGSLDKQDKRLVPVQFVYVLISNFVEECEGRVNDLKKRKIVNDALRRKVENTVELDNIDLSSDGQHYSPTGHKQTAKAVYEKIKELE